MKKDSNKRYDYVFSSEEIDSISTLANILRDEFETVESEDFAERCYLLSQELPLTIKKFAYEFKMLKTGSSSMRFQGFPIEIGHIPTPTSWDESWIKSPTFYEETVHCIVSCVFGEIFGWLTQENGRFMRHVVPVKGQEYTQLGTSSKGNLDWHVEEAFHPSRADFVSLMCYRNDENSITTSCSVDSVLTKLRQETKEILSQERFLIPPDSSHTKKHNVSNLWERNDSLFDTVNDSDLYGKKVSILYGHKEKPFFRPDEAYMQPYPGDKQAEAALAELVEIVSESLEETILSPGEILVFDNKRCVHGRRPFIPNPNGRSRWLRRLNLACDLRSISSTNNEPYSRKLI